jgi:hypothetical protein
MKTSTRDGAKISFYKSNKLIGTIDYSAHSEYYIEDAIENWQTGVLTEDIIETFNIGENK